MPPCISIWSGFDQFRRQLYTISEDSREILPGPSLCYECQSAILNCLSLPFPQGNMQRCKLVMDQITEARDTMMKVLDHKEKVMKLINKNGGAKKVNKLKCKDKV